MLRIYPNATYAPLPEAESQTTIVPVLIILHTIVGSASGAENVMRGDWYGESHFVLPFSSQGRQLVPLDRRADCNWQVNAWTTQVPLTLADGRVLPAGTVCGAISIETEDDGTPEDTPWTISQVDWMARFIAWASVEWDIPLNTPADPFSPGVGYHSFFGKNTLAIWDTPGAVPPYGTMLDKSGRVVNIYNPWTNTVGKSCPGEARIQQFPSVLALARQYAGTTPTTPTPPVEEDDMLKLISPKQDIGVFLLDGLVATWVQDGNVQKALEAQPGIVAPGVAEVDRLFLKALELHGPAPTDQAYAGATAADPGRTKTTDFAVWRP